MTFLSWAQVAALAEAHPRPVPDVHRPGGGQRNALERACRAAPGPPRRAGIPKPGGPPADLLQLLERGVLPGHGAGWGACRFHDQRHTSVALAIAEGARPKATKTRMGHSSINVTLDRYGHLLPELDEALAQSFGERLAAAQAAPGGGSEAPLLRPVV